MTVHLLINTKVKKTGIVKNQIIEFQKREKLRQNNCAMFHEIRHNDVKREQKQGQ